MQAVHQRGEKNAFVTAAGERFNRSVGIEPLATVVLTLTVSGSVAAVGTSLANDVVAEAQAIWRHAGVDVRRLSPDEARQRPADVYVFFTRQPPVRTATSHAAPLAWILFTAGQPSNRVFVSRDAARLLLQRDGRLGTLFSALPPNGRDRMMGRVMGRALAHEIGHYLFASTGHTRTGLMRATQSIASLATDDTKAFRVDATSLHARRDAGPAEDCALLHRGWDALP